MSSRQNAMLASLHYCPVAVVINEKKKHRSRSKKERSLYNKHLLKTFTFMCSVKKNAFHDTHHTTLAIRLFSLKK